MEGLPRADCNPLPRGAATPETDNISDEISPASPALKIRGLLNRSPYDSRTLELAQLPPPPPPATPLPQITPSPLPPPAELLTPPGQQPPQPVPPAAVPGTFTVNRFEFTGNTAFSSKELAAVTSPYTGHPITFGELLQARSAVTQLYVDKGYVTSGALISPQKLTSGVVTIEIVEGTLEDIKITGTERLHPGYVLSRINAASSGALNVPRLLQALRLLQLNPLIQSISAELSAGSQPGSSVLIVRVQEANSFNTAISLANDRSPSVGSFRRGVLFREGNLTGAGDALSFAYDNTDGSDAVDLSYTLPFNSHNGTFTISYSSTLSTVIESPFNRIDIEADASYFDITLRQPLVQTPSQEFALGLTASRRESYTTLLGVPFPLSPGSDNNGATRISAVRFFQEWTQRGAAQVISARSQFNLGVGAFNSTLNKKAPDSQFFSWRGQAQWVRLLAPDTLFLVRGDVQVSDRPLVPLEQIGIGGHDSVRGYRLDTILADNGAIFSTELRLPILRIPQWQGILHFIPFFDVGTAWSSGGAEPNPSTLAAAGMGLQLALGERFNARLDWGIPLNYTVPNPRTWQEKGLYFSVIVNP